MLSASLADAAADADADAPWRCPLRNHAATKHSWRGRYVRLLAVCPLGVCTYDPETRAVTNAWRFEGGEYGGVTLGEVWWLCVCGAGGIAALTPSSHVFGRRRRAS